MSGTPVWEPSDCLNDSSKLTAPRSRHDFSPQEVKLADASYREVVERSGHLLTMPFLKAPGGTYLSEYYPNAGLMGVVGRIRMTFFL